MNSYEVSLAVEALIVNNFNLYWKNNLIVGNLRGWAKKRTEAIWKNEIFNCAKIEDLFYYNFKNEFDWVKSLDFINNNYYYSKFQCNDADTKERSYKIKILLKDLPIYSLTVYEIGVNVLTVIYALGAKKISMLGSTCGPVNVTNSRITIREINVHSIFEYEEKLQEKGDLDEIEILHIPFIQLYENSQVLLGFTREWEMLRGIYNNAFNDILKSKETKMMIFDLKGLVLSRIDKRKRKMLMEGDEKEVDVGNLVTKDKAIQNTIDNRSVKKSWKLEEAKNDSIIHFVGRSESWSQKQLKYDGDDNVFEWIPYSELIDIEDIGANCLATAILKNGSLYYIEDEKGWIRRPCEQVCLRYLYNSQDITDVINKIESYSLRKTKYLMECCYGITQNPDTRDYILQLKFNGLGAVFEWVPYNELVFINEVEKSVIVTAIRKDGQLYYDINKNDWTRKLNEKVVLRFLYDLQNINEYEFLNKVESYLLLENEDENENSLNYGISQNPNTNVYILVFKKQLKYNGRESVFEWIPFNELIIIKEIEDSCSTTAILKNGSLYYNEREYRWVRNPCEKVCLKYLHNSHNITDEFITEIKPYTDNCYGFSQNPDTKEHILVFSYKHFDNYCIKCGNQYVGYGWYINVFLNETVYLINENEFINKIKVYPNQILNYYIIKLYGISQDSNTKDYIMVFEYADSGNFNNYVDKNYESFNWFNVIEALTNIIGGLSEIHQKQMVHRDFHLGNILFASKNSYSKKMAHISDIGLYRKIDDVNETSIYGVMPYVAPELKLLDFTYNHGSRV
ncbi:kinase-like domain-containing protein [Rhizophagus irregularis DAOM 181602=DAOM 197198]|nr:kinase-like domain-containing protein [Rhizophagus irregularis DAOM 181602=DAOM 197198]